MNRRPSFASLLSKIEKSDPFPPFSGPPTKKDITVAENELGLEIRGDFRVFVERLGDQDDFGFCGVSCKYEKAGTSGVTSVMRREHGLPEHYLVVWADEDDAEAYALDCREVDARGNSPVDYFRPANLEESLTRQYRSFRALVEDHYRSLWK